LAGHIPQTLVARTNWLHSELDSESLTRRELDVALCIWVEAFARGSDLVAAGLEIQEPERSIAGGLGGRAFAIRKILKQNCNVPEAEVGWRPNNALDRRRSSRGLPGNALRSILAARPGVCGAREQQ
jgi:hypothetical protein